MAIGRDVRYAFRNLRRSPGFTFIALLTLALGIGANAAIFSVVNAVILRPLPFPRSRELVRVTSDFTGHHQKDAGLSALELRDYQASGIFSDVSGVWALDANITGMDRPERAELLLTDVNYFRLLGVRAQVGRLFLPEDYRPGITEIAVISDAWWHRHYGADPSAVGRQFRLDDDLYTIIGVAPPGFRHPGRTLESDVDVWAPAGWVASPFPAPTRRAYYLTGAIGRLAPGWTIGAARRRIAELAGRWRRDDPNAYPNAEGWAPRIIPLQDDVVGNVRSALIVLSAAVGLVLLIACANVANLLLARASARRRELAIRRALGASRGQLLRQLLTESLVLSVTGGALGLALAYWGIDLLVRLSPDRFPRLVEVGVDLRVLAFALAASVATGVVFGLAPALSASNAAPHEGLKDGERGGSGARGGRLRSALVVAEFALSLVLLVAAGLLVQTLWRLQRVDPGFDSRNLSMAGLRMPQPNLVETGRYYEHSARATLYRKILQRAEAIPGVEAAVATSRVPFGSSRDNVRFRIEGRDPEHGGTSAADLALVSPGYFAAMRIPLQRGRLFAERDDEKGEPVAILSESLARVAFPGEDPLGRRVQLPARRDGPEHWTTIVGVVRDVKMEALDLEDRPAIYLPLWQSSDMSVTLVLRGPGRPAELAGRIEEAVRGIDSELPIYAVRSMEESMAATVAQRGFAMRLLALFAAAALALSALGIYGVIAYGVSRRTREIGIRMALGARPRDVQSLILGQGLRLILTGVAFGVAGALALTRALAALLYGISPHDPATFGAIAALLTAVALAAIWFPARRAARVDPTVALRSE
jgi:putative ABC transport system permease protein